MLSIRRADLLLGGYTAPEKPSFITFKSMRPLRSGRTTGFNGKR
jgi:hypothetical protein